MKVIQNHKIAIKTAQFVTGILLVSFFILGQVISHKSSLIIKESITDEMTDAIETRTTMIDNYITSAEDFLVGFAQSEEVRRMLKNPTPENIRKAQRYTEDFGKAKKGLRGSTLAVRIPILMHTQ